MVEYDNEKFPIHKAAFHNDVQTLSRLLSEGEIDIGAQDPHGNTPLHIATMLGHKEAITLLLSKNAPVKTKNSQGYSSLMEAISYGNRQTINLMLRKLKSQAREHLSSRKPHLMKVLGSIDDFYMEIKWDFHSWVPLLTRILPSDVCKIYKHGTALRMDTTLVDFNDRSWERGDISFIYNPQVEHLKQHLVVLDNKKKVYQKLKNSSVEKDIEEEVDVLMSSDIVSAQMSTKPITFQPMMAGWFFRHEKSDMVGTFSTNYYNVDNLNLVSKKRREHLTQDDIKNNKTYLQSFAHGKNIPDENDMKSFEHRPDLPPPAIPKVTWEEYIYSSEFVHLGRPMDVKINSKSFKAGIGLSPEFPLGVNTLIDILEVIAPLKHMNKMRHFCEGRMPHGFPVRLEIPLLPTITAKITFQKFQWCDNLSMKFFRVPRSYTEDTNRFPEL
uniref:Ankyrin repeat domain-containing protein 13C n=1 Tax=Panagrolaimus superbus TaxID=310955 RepID=A0A914YFE4_9BILA